MEPIGPESVLTVLGLTVKNLIAGALGSFVSLRFFDDLTLKDRWITFIGGWAMGVFLAEPITTFFEQTPKIEVGVALLTSMFGMALASKVIQIVRETNWIDLFKGTRK